MDVDQDHVADDVGVTGNPHSPVPCVVAAGEGVHEAARAEEDSHSSSPPQFQHLLDDDMDLVLNDSLAAADPMAALLADL